MGVFSSFREFAGINPTKASKEIESIKNVKSSVKSFDEAIEKSVVKIDASVGKINDVNISKFRDAVSSGNLKKAMSDINPNTFISDTENIAFKRIVGDTPEVKLSDLDDFTSVKKTTNSELNIKPSELDTASSEVKSSLSKIEKKGTSVFGDTAKVALVIGGITFGALWLTKAVKDRIGCWMVTTINGKATSCKIKDYYCNDNASDNNYCGSTPSFYSVILLTIHATQDAKWAESLITHSESNLVKDDFVESNLSNLVKTKMTYIADAITEYLKTSTNVLPTISPCKVSSKYYEGGVIPPCRMCDPSASPLSTTFVDPKQYAENITFKCVPTASYLDVISDIIHTTGKDLFGSNLSGNIKKIGIWVAVIFVLLVIISVAIKLFRRK